MKQKTGKRNHSVILTLLLIAVICYFCVAFFNLYSILREEKQEVARIEAMYAQQEFENSELERILQQGNEDELIERIARNELHYAYPNERIYTKSPVGAQDAE